MDKRASEGKNVRGPSTTGPLEEQLTQVIKTVDSAAMSEEQQEKIVSPRLSMRQRLSTSTQSERSRLLSKKRLIAGRLETECLEEEPTLHLAADGDKHVKADTSPQKWKPGTFGFTQERDGETDASVAALQADAVATDTIGAAPDARKAGQSVMIRLISWALPVPVVFIVTVLLTHYLGPTAYGEYSLTFTVFTVFALVSGTGMDQLFIRRLTREPRAEWGNILGDAIGTRLLSTAASSIIAIILALVIPMDVALRYMLLLGSIWLFFSFSVNTLVTAYSSGFIAEQRIGKLSLLTMVNRLVTSGLVALLVFLHCSLVWTYAIVVYSDLPFFVALLILAHRRFHIRVRFHLASNRKYYLKGLPLTGHDALGVLNNQADMFLLMFLADPLSVGLYALATKLTDPLLSVAYAYLGGLYPLLCVKFEEGREQFTQIYKESVRIIALGIIPLAIFITVEARPIIFVFGGAGFAPAALALQLLMWATAATFLQQLATRGCTAANLERQMPYMSGITVAVNVGANFLLIPLWQCVGAATAALISTTISLCLFMLLLVKHIRLFSVIGIFLRVVLGNVPMLLVLLWLRDASFLIIVPLSLVVCAAGCFIMRVLSIQDVYALLNMLRLKKSKNADGQSDKTVPSIEDITDIADYPTAIIPTIRV